MSLLTFANVYYFLRLLTFTIIFGHLTHLWVKLIYFLVCNQSS